MPVRISCPLPVSGTSGLVEIYRSDAATGPFSQIDSLPAPLPVDDKGNFFYEDFMGEATKFYRCIFFDGSGVTLKDTGVFSPSSIGGLDVPTKVKVDHNYPLGDSLRYTHNGNPISDAVVRVFRAVDWDLGLRDVGLAVTFTREDGRWASPFWLATGLDYVVCFSKEAMYGPDPVRITV
jgi:hypothetical protein